MSNERHVYANKAKTEVRQTCLKHLKSEKHRAREPRNLTHELPHESAHENAHESVHEDVHGKAHEGWGFSV